MTLMYPKPVRTESKVVREFARGQECTLLIPGVCNGDWSTTVHCHLRMFGLQGVNQKPDDIHGIHACSACHRVLDNRSAWELLGWDDVLRALMITQKRLIAAGLIMTKG